MNNQTIAIFGFSFALLGAIAYGVRLFHQRICSSSTYKPFRMSGQAWAAIAVAQEFGSLVLKVKDKLVAVCPGEIISIAGEIPELHEVNSHQEGGYTEYQLRLPEESAICIRGVWYVNHDGTNLDESIRLFLQITRKDVEAYPEIYREALSDAKPEDLQLLKEIAEGRSATCMELMRRELSMDLVAVMITIRGTDLIGQLFPA